MEFHFTIKLVVVLTIACFAGAIFVTVNLSRHTSNFSKIQSRQWWEVFVTVFGVLGPGIVIWKLTYWWAGASFWVASSVFFLLLFRFFERGYLKKKYDEEFDRYQRRGEDISSILQGRHKRDVKKRD